VAAGTHRKVLVIGADTMSRIVDYTDRATCILFGDAAGAMLIEPTGDGEDDLGLIDFIGEVDGSGGDFLKMPAGGSRLPASHETVDKRQHFVFQDGSQVFKYAVRKMYESCSTLLARNGLTAADVAVVVPHQANNGSSTPPPSAWASPRRSPHQHRPLREHRRRHHPAGHARRHSRGPPPQGRHRALHRRGRGLHRRCQHLALAY